MLENTAKQCIPSLEIGDLSERKMQAVSCIPAVFLTTKNSHKVEPPGVEPGSKQATRAAFSMLSPRLIFDQRLTVDGPSLT